MQLDRKIFATCLRGSPSGSSPGPGGCTNEMLRVVLDDPEALVFLTAAAEDFAGADVPVYFRGFHVGDDDCVAKTGRRSERFTERQPLTRSGHACLSVLLWPN